MPSYILTFLLFILPFLILPFGFSPFEIPKVIVAEVLIEFLLLFLLFKAKKLELRSLKPFIFIGGLFLVSLISTLFNFSSNSIFGNLFRLQGVFLLWNLLIFGLISAKYSPLKLSGITYFVILLIQLLASLFILPNVSNRLVGTLGEPNALAAFVVFLWPFVFFKNPRIIKIIGFILATFLIIFTGSRSGLIALAIESVFMGLIYTKLALKKIVLISLILISCSLTLPFIEGGGWYENRAEIWQTAWSYGLNNPLIGGGFGNVQEALHQESLKLGNNVQYQVVDSSHNFLLDFFVQGGLIAILLIVLLLYQVFKNLVAKEKKLELSLMLGILTIMLFNPSSIVTLLAFWWIIGMSFV